jgi:hypothetical protein
LFVAKAQRHLYKLEGISLASKMILTLLFFLLYFSLEFLCTIIANLVVFPFWSAIFVSRIFNQYSFAASTEHIAAAPSSLLVERCFAARAVSQKVQASIFLFFKYL